MTITLELTPDEERRLLDRAARSGQDPMTFLHEMIRDKLQDGPKASPPDLDQALAPFRRDFQASGMTEADLDDLVEEVREEIWAEKHGRPSRA